MGIKFSTTVPQKVVKPKTEPKIEKPSSQHLVESRVIDYCHEVSIAIGADGQVTPSNIVLGNYGDANITRLTIKLDKLKNHHQKHYDLTLYDHLLLLKNPTTQIIETYDCKYNAAKNEASLEIPENITSTLAPGTYKLIYVLQEQEHVGANTTHAEQFVSNEFNGVINKTN